MIKETRKYILDSASYIVSQDREYIFESSENSNLWRVYLDTYFVISTLPNKDIEIIKLREKRNL